jgi:hypothetical protein
MTPEERKRIFEQAVMATAITRAIRGGYESSIVTWITVKAARVPAEKIREDIEQEVYDFLDSHFPKGWRA